MQAVVDTWMERVFKRQTNAEGKHVVRRNNLLFTNVCFGSAFFYIHHAGVYKIVFKSPRGVE